MVARKLLGHMVSSGGIKVDPTKIKSILEMPPLKTEKEVRGFLGKLQYISWFIARLTSNIKPSLSFLEMGNPKNETMTAKKLSRLSKDI
jgi:hypothetical protein